MAGVCGHDDKPSGSIREFLDERNIKLFTKTLYCGVNHSVKKEMYGSVAVKVSIQYMPSLCHSYSLTFYT